MSYPHFVSAHDIQGTYNGKKKSKKCFGIVFRGEHERRPTLRNSAPDSPTFGTISKDNLTRV